MQKLLSRLIVLLALMFSGATFADLRIASWNIERLGHGDNKSYEALAHIGEGFDFIAVQEAMTTRGVDELEAALERKSGEKWGVMYSHLIGRGKYKEMYAFLWRESAVEYLDGAVVYLDRGDAYTREPYSARFRSKRTGQPFVAATIHVLFGKSIEERLPEVQALANYWVWLQEVYPQTPILLMGDFNLPPTHEAWGALKRYARPLVTSGASTVSSTEGKFANLYDNIWVDKQSALALGSAGVLNGPKALGWTHEQFREYASDHVPVFVALGRSEVARSGVRPVQYGRAEESVRSGVKSAAVVEVRGNRNSQVYHLPGCGSYDKVSESNRVLFQSEAAAVAAGYRKAGNCT